MSDKYAANENVFAKLKGFPPWPAKIMERVSGKDEKYRIVFYGTYDEATVKLDQLFRYNDDTKAKYGKPQRKAHFNEAMAEIEAAILGEEPGSLEEPEEQEQEETNKGESEGELTIDEGPPSLPPILTRENDKPIVAEAKGSKAKRPRTLGKRDSLNAPATPPLVVATAVVEPLNTPTTPESGTEIVSRSGRKIKPKRFADDEITPSPLGKGGKAGPEDTQPAKRTKRVSSAKSATLAKGSEEDTSAVLKGEAENGVAITGIKSVTTSKGKQTNVVRAPSPDIAEPKSLPALKSASKRISSSSSKKLPSLEPNTSSVTTQRKSERQTRSNSQEDVIAVGTSIQASAGSGISELDESELDKENSNNSDEITLNGNNSVVDEEIFIKPKEPVKPPTPGHEVKQFETKAGLKFELSYNIKNQRGEVDNKTWKAAAEENVRKIIDDLEDDVESQEFLNSIVDGITTRTDEEEEERDNISSQLKMLRLEGEVIEIIGEIVGCLGAHSADCIRAIDLLERLEEHKLNRLMLKKHPEVVSTIQRLRCYVGNIEAWDTCDAAEKEEFLSCAEEIRRKAVSIFKHFQELFEAESTDAFIEIFQEELQLFRGKFVEWPLKKILGLTEVNGELKELELDIEINSDGDGEEEM